LIRRGARSSGYQLGVKYDCTHDHHFLEPQLPTRAVRWAFTKERLTPVNGGFCHEQVK
jgi:hypothetical protein